MDHINIISQEAIKKGSSIPMIVFGCLVLVAVVVSAIISHKKQNMDIIAVTIGIGFYICLPIMLLLQLISNNFILVDTGRCKYVATIEEDLMTVAEYREFSEQYTNIEYIDGLYYFEDKEE